MLMTATLGDSKFVNLLRTVCPDRSQPGTREPLKKSAPPLKIRSVAFKIVIKKKLKIKLLFTVKTNSA